MIILKWDFLISITNIKWTKNRPGYNPDKAATILDRVGSLVRMQGKDVVTANDVSLVFN